MENYLWHLHYTPVGKGKVLVITLPELENIKLVMDTLGARARLHKKPVTTTGIRTCTRNLGQLHEIT